MAKKKNQQKKTNERRYEHKTHHTKRKTDDTNSTKKCKKVKVQFQWWNNQELYEQGEFKLICLETFKNSLQ